MIRNVQIRLQAYPPGYHLITEPILQQLLPLPQEGLLSLFIRHTSAALLISENADPDVRHDMTLYMDRLAPEHLAGIRHTSEGPDDMPAHVKSALIGSSIQIPVTGGQLGLGTWQGIYLCEFRVNARQRNLIASIYS